MEQGSLFREKLYLKKKYILNQEKESLAVDPSHAKCHASSVLIPCWFPTPYPVRKRWQSFGKLIPEEAFSLNDNSEKRNQQRLSELLIDTGREST